VPGGAPAALTVGAADRRERTATVRVVVRAGLHVVLDRELPLAGAAALIVLALRAPGLLLFPTPELAAQREGYDRLRRLSRHDLIDRAARTYHLLEGRYPASLGELVERRILPPRAQYDPNRAAYRISSKAEEYQLHVASEDGSGGAREGVFGDFLLDRELFAQLQADEGVPLVLID